MEAGMMKEICIN